MITDDQIPILEEILWEFEGSSPEVCLIPSKDEACAKDGGMIRVATISNPEWYKKMCADFPRKAQPSQLREKRFNKRTIIKRIGTARIIRTLIKYRESKSKYAPYIIDEMDRRIEMHEDQFEPWDNQF